MRQSRPTHSILISNREKQVLELISHERTMLEISNALFISYHTVVSHRKKLLEKLNARNTAGLIRRGGELRILNNENGKGRLCVS